MPDEVVSRSQVPGDLAAPLEVLDNQCGSPVGAVQLASPHAHLVNLEPALSVALAGRTEGARALEQPHLNRALLVRPLLPDGGDVGPGLHGGAELGRGAPVATHLGVGDAHGRVVVGPLELDRLGGAGRGETLVAGVGGAADDVAGYGTVGGDERRKGRESEEVKSHDDWLSRVCSTVLVDSVGEWSVGEGR